MYHYNLSILQKLFPTDETGLVFKKPGTLCICLWSFLSFWSTLFYLHSGVLPIEIHSLSLAWFSRLSTCPRNMLFGRTQTLNAGTFMPWCCRSLGLTPIKAENSPKRISWPIWCLYANRQVTNRFPGSFELLLLCALTGVSLVELTGSTSVHKGKRETAASREWFHVAKMMHQREEWFLTTGNDPMIIWGTTDTNNCDRCQRKSGTQSPSLSHYLGRLQLLCSRIWMFYWYAYLG